MPISIRCMPRAYLRLDPTSVNESQEEIQVVLNCHVANGHSYCPGGLTIDQVIQVTADMTSLDVYK